MPANEYTTDLEIFLAKRYHNGGDYWATPDNRLVVGAPFSTLESLLSLHELRVDNDHEVVHGALNLIFDAAREDGRFKLSKSGTLYPCFTVNTARILCRFGLANDSRLELTFDNLLTNRHYDGGWRCSKYGHGKGPETECSNPGVTIFALDALRFTNLINKNADFDNAVETLLAHWEIRRPLGPCQFGIGTLFMQIEYPFLRYNLFYYVYILSFYDYAKKDKRFLDALRELESKLDENGNVVVERPNRQLAKLKFCEKGKPSELATLRYQEIKKNLSR